jgi:hypothetical protein
MKSKIVLATLMLFSTLSNLKSQTPQPTNVTISVNGVASSSVNYCAGTNLELEANANCPFASGSSLFSFTWSGGPGIVTGPNKFSVNPTTNTIYTVTAVPTFTMSGVSCAPGTATVSVKYMPQTPNVVQLPSLVCAGNDFKLRVQNSPGPNNSYTYGWQTSLDQGNTTYFGNPSTTYSSTTTGTYTVNFTSTSPAGCTGSLSGPFTINTAPCAIGIIHSNLLLTSYTSATVSIQNDVDVVGSVSLNQSNVYISPNKKITVKTGSDLTISGSWLHSCSCPWEGIVVEPGAKLFILNASVIEDANTAISSIATSATNIINVSNTLFNKCNIGVDLISSSAINMNSNLIIRKSIFSCRNIASSTTYNNIANYNALHANFELAVDFDTQSSAALSMTNSIDNVAPKITLPNGKRSHIGIRFTDHSIATINPLREVNIFDNMDYGVYARVSSINIQSAHFMNMPGNNINLDGIAVYSIDTKNEDLNSECIVRNCQINDVCRGIHVENIINVNIIRNIISSGSTTANYNLPAKKSGQYGIYYSFFARTPTSLVAPTTWVIGANSIRNHLYGAAIIRNNYLGASENKFECNTIFGSQTLPPANPNSAYCIVGLYINDGLGNAGGVGGPGSNPEVKNGELHMSGNDIVRVRKHALEFINVQQNTIIEKNENDIANSAFGAYILNSYGPLGFTLRDNVPNAATVSLTDCRNILLWWNNILGYPFAPNILANKTTGIKCIRSQARIIKNTIARNQNDIWFYGNCNPSTVAQNKFFYATNAMYFSNDAQIGQQGNPTSPAANIFTSSPVGARVIWQTNMANAIIPASASTFYWSNVGAVDEKMPNPKQTTTAPATSSDIFTNAGNGLVRINVNAGLLAEPQTFCGDPTPIPPPNSFIDSIPANFQDSIVLTKKLILDDLSNQEFANEKWWNNKLNAMALIESNTTMIGQDAVIAAFYNNNQQTDLGKINRVYEYAKTGYTQMAASVNSTVLGNDINENYRKAVNEIYLAMVNDSLYIPDSVAIAALEIVANSCPDAYGNVVYQARNILIGLKRQVIEFTDDCMQQNNNRMVHINTTKQTKLLNEVYHTFNLYPNPNSGTFTIESLRDKEINGTIHVTDILGKTILKQNFSNRTELNISSAATKGIYFIKVINEENKTVYTGKVIVQ